MEFKRMPALKPLCYLMRIQPDSLTKEENTLLEIELFTRIHEELKEIFKQQYKEYFRLLKFTLEKEDTMIETKCMRLIIQDILSTNEYDLNGIAYYTNTHEEVIQEIYMEQNTNPSSILLRKIIELHRVVRHDLYLQIAKKIASKYLSVA